MSEPSTWRDEYTDALQVLADVYLQQGQAQKAVILLEALARLAPTHAGVLRILSHACLCAERHEEALTAVDALLRLESPGPELAPAVLIRAQALWALGRMSEAQESLRRYLQWREAM